MTNQEYKLQLSALKSTLEIVLIEAEKKGKEISMAYECGMYIGTIKGIITHLEELTQDNDWSPCNPTGHWQTSKL